MKITNQQMVNFMNLVHGHKGESGKLEGGLIERNIPRKLYSALDLNLKALSAAADTYNKQLAECKDDTAAVRELLNIEIEVVIQTVPEEVFDRMDESEKFDSLSGIEYSTLQFMIIK